MPATMSSQGYQTTAPSLAAARGYLRAAVPILKQIAAVAGQRVCIRDAVVYVDDVATRPNVGPSTHGSVR